MTKYIVVEQHDKDEYVWNHTPDYGSGVMAVQAEFIWKASKVLTEFHQQWMADHEDDTFANGLEIDHATVTTDGMLMGFMHLSEDDPHGYDYAPSEMVKPENVRLIGSKQEGRE